MTEEKWHRFSNKKKDASLLRKSSVIKIRDDRLVHGGKKNT